MRDLQDLKRTADCALGGLTAGPELKKRIAEASTKPVRPYRRALYVAVACALTLAVALGVTLPGMRGSNDQLIISGPLGNASTGSQRADIGNSNVSVSTGSVPEYSSIWAKATDGVFPLVRVSGRWYRLLTAPSSVEKKHLGSSLGKIEEYSSEPSLSSSDCLLSNTVSAGCDVYPVSGMESTLVAAEVNGKLRVFQRVSFNDNALISKEKLSDTLQLSGHIQRMELSGVGTVTDSGTAESLFSTLVRNASYESSGTVSGKQSLHIVLDNGLTVQLAVKGDRLAACGVWSCPEFIEAFASAVQGN